MYLALLGKEEKELFLGLAYNMAASDGYYSDVEKETIAEYCKEMQIDFNENTMIKPIEKLLNRFNEISDGKIKKIIVFELIGLAMVDNNYNVEEKKLMKKIEEAFGIEQGFDEKCELIISEYISFQQKINQLILS